MNTIKTFADSHETDIAIASAIFEIANNDELLAEKIWENGDPRVAPLAFSKTEDDQLCWGCELISRS